MLVRVSCERTKESPVGIYLFLVFRCSIDFFVFVVFHVLGHRPSEMPLQADLMADTAGSVLNESSPVTPCVLFLFVSSFLCVILSI
jgi:hypothetical protein